MFVIYFKIPKITNSEGKYHLIAEGLKNIEIEIKDKNIWNYIKEDANE